MIFRYIFIILLFVVNIFATNILILNSYEINLEWTNEQYKAIKDSLKNSKIKNIQLHVEFMDTKIFRPTDIIYKNQIEYYAKKYKNIEFDIVITTDDNALNFVRKYKNTKNFKKSKVFFCGVNNLSLYKILPHDTYAGIFEKKDPMANLNIAKKINKKLKTIYLISDETITAAKLIKEYKKAYNNIKGIDFVYINHKNIIDVTNKLQYYDKNSVAIILLFTSFFTDKQRLSVKDVTQKITRIYQNPILIHTNIYINYKNIVGGNCVSGIQQGINVAKKVIEFLNGKSIKDIGFMLKSPNSYYFNYKNTEKFGIDIDKLNINKPIVINKPISFYTLY